MIWLSTSLFCKKAHWNKLLDLGIKPFVENNKLVKAFKINFSYLSGDNLQLALLTELDSRIELSNITADYFKHYFQGVAQPSIGLQLGFSGIFMPFSANSIQFGLYQPETLTIVELQKYSLCNGLSQAMIAALKDEIDDEIILTFGIYLQVGIIKVLFNSMSDLNDLFYLFDENIYNDDKTSSILIANEGIIYEIIQDAVESHLSNQMEWFNQWCDVCRKNLIDIIDGDAVVIKKTYQQMVCSIYRQLAINSYGQTSISLLVEKKFMQICL